MEELLHASFAPANVLASGLLIFVLLYWLTVLVGLLDISSLDIDLDTHGGADSDLFGSVGWFNATLAFFHLGRVPLMFFLSFFSLAFWALSVGVNHALETQSNGFGFVLLLPIFVMCLFVGKVLTWPFMALFASMEVKGESTQHLIGQVCTILLPADGARLGQAAVKTKGAPVLLNVKTLQGHLVRKGETAVVLEYQPETNSYLIEPYQSI